MSTPTKCHAKNTATCPYHASMEVYTARIAERFGISFMHMPNSNMPVKVGAHRRYQVAEWLKDAVAQNPAFFKRAGSYAAWLAAVSKASSWQGFELTHASKYAQERMNLTVNADDSASVK